MSPERTSHATSLPVRADRAQRADQPASGDLFATLLGAHADRPERAPARRERRDDAAPSQTDRRPAERPADRRHPARDTQAPAQPADATQAATPADEAAAAALLALAVPTPPPVPADPAPAAATAPPAEAQPGQVEALPVAATEAAAAGNAAPLSQGANDQRVAPATVEPTPVGATTDTPVTPVVPLDAETAPVGTPDEASADRAAELPNLPSAPRAEATPRHEAPTVPNLDIPATPAQTGDASARQGDGRPAQREPAQPAAQATQAAAPTATTRTDFAPVAASPATPAGAPAGAATLSQAPRAVGQLIYLASQKGVQHARLNLRPVELGGIEIRLQSTAAGIAAQLVADSPQAARLLQQASEDLRRSLASQNVELLSLDVSTSGDERGDASAASDLFGGFGDSATRGQAGSSRAQRTSVAHADTDLPDANQGTVLELPDGVLVDILA